MRTRLIEAEAIRSTWSQRLLRRLRLQARPPPVHGLYLWGGVGRGKTWLMDLFFQSLPFARRRRRHFHRFMHDVHVELARVHHSVAPLERIASRLAREARVLCLDELMVTDIADAMLLGGLFAGLFKRGVTLVATSNVAPAELYRDGLQRQRFLPAVALLEQHLEILHVDGPVDHRLRQLTQAGTYLASGAPDTQMRLASLFAELSDRAELPGRSVDIAGRPLAVVRRAAGAIWFEFDVLCGGPRSQDDYIEIAREYQSVILANVPIFTPASEDEARRFIAAVDEFYDRRVNLVVSAAAPPDQLYRGQRLAEPFQRTVSRLMEMQSAEYLASEHRG